MVLQTQVGPCKAARCDAFNHRVSYGRASGVTAAAAAAAAAARLEACGRRSHVAPRCVDDRAAAAAATAGAAAATAGAGVASTRGHHECGNNCSCTMHRAAPPPGVTAAAAVAAVAASLGWPAVAAAADAATAAAAAATAAMAGPVDAATYVPSPMDGPGWQVWFGAVIGVVPFVIGAYEFTKRILIQRRCEVCRGSGLVVSGPSARPRKCPECGGMFPWVSWRMFLSAAARPGNGGPLLQPRGQTSVFYTVPPPPPVPAPTTEARGEASPTSPATTTTTTTTTSQEEQQRRD